MHEPPAFTTAAVALALAACAFAAGEARAQESNPDSEPRNPGGSFHETFDGDRPDGGLWFVSSGWVNSSNHGCEWSADALRQRNGRLELEIRTESREKRPYVCAELQSHAHFGPGVYEARIRAQREPGTVGGFFTYTGPHFGDPHDEIDFEWVGERPGTVQTNLWRDGDQGDGQITHDLGFDPAEDFHDYAFVWEPDSVRWYIDGELVREVTDPARIPTTASKVYLSLFSGIEAFVPWLGAYEPEGRTPRMEVEHIAYTAPGDPCPFPGSLACDTDDGS